MPSLNNYTLKNYALNNFNYYLKSLLITNIQLREPNDLVDGEWLKSTNFNSAFGIRENNSLLLGKNIYFDGADDYLRISDSDTWTFGSDNFSIVVLLKKDGDNKYYSVMRQGRADYALTTQAFSIDIHSDNKIACEVFQGSNNRGITSTSTFTGTDWLQIAVVRNGPNLFLYVNGVEAGTISTLSTSSLNNSSNPVYVGATEVFGSVSNFFKGYMQSIQVYHRALSVTELNELYNNKISPTSLIGLWRLETTYTDGGDTFTPDEIDDNDAQIIGASMRNMLSGNRISNPINLDSIKNVLSSTISWESTEPADTEIKIYSQVNDNFQEPDGIFPDDWDECTNGHSITNINITDDLSNKILWIRQNFSTSDTTKTSELESLSVEIKGR